MPKRNRVRTQLAPVVPAAGKPPERRDVASDGRIALALAALAALLRGLFVLSGDDRAFPYTVFYEGDSEAYFRLARSFVEGTLYDEGVPFHPPGASFLLAAWHFLIGASEVGARVPHLATKLFLGTVIGGGSVALLFLLAKRFFPRPVALVAGLLAAFHFGLYVLSVAPVADGLFQLLLLGALLRAAPTLARGEVLDTRAAATLGLLLGAMILTRAEGALPAAIVLASGLAVTWRSGVRGRAGLRPWLVAAVVATLVVAPWTIRNAVRMGELEARLGASVAEPLPRFVPVTMYGPLNLALANHSGADGSFSRDVLSSEAGSGVLRFENPEHLRYLLHGGDIAREWIADHPGEFARLVLRKWRLYFGALELGWTQWNFPGGLAGVRRPVDLFVPDRSWGGAFLAALVLAGAILAWRDGGAARRWVVLTGALTAAALGVVALFFGYARLGLILLPLWLVLASLALVRLVSKMPARPVQRSAVGVVVLLFVVEVYGAVRGHRLQATGSTYGPRRTLDRDQPIRFAPLPPR